jgi:hypothetical protein
MQRIMAARRQDSGGQIVPRISFRNPIACLAVATVPNGLVVLIPV